MISPCTGSVSLDKCQSHQLSPWWYIKIHYLQFSPRMWAWGSSCSDEGSNRYLEHLVTLGLWMNPGAVWTVSCSTRNARSGSLLVSQVERCPTFLSWVRHWLLVLSWFLMFLDLSGKIFMCWEVSLVKDHCAARELWYVQGWQQRSSEFAEVKLRPM